MVPPYCDYFFELLLNSLHFNHSRFKSFRMAFKVKAKE